MINCLLNATVEQNLLKFTMNTDTFQRRFGSRMQVNAHLLADMYPKILDKVAATQQLDIEIEILHPNITFSPADRIDDMRTYFDVNFGVKIHGDKNYLVYDQFCVEWFNNLSVRDEVLYATISEVNSWPWKPIGKPNRKVPVQNSLGMNEQDYKIFWDWMDAKISRWQFFVNEGIFSAGVPLPYHHLAFSSIMQFKEHAMLMAMGIHYGRG